MKNDIDWHKECLKNMMANLARERINLENIIKAIQLGEQSILFYQRQIETAEKQNKVSFDRDRFLVKNKKRINNCLKNYR